MAKSPGSILKRKGLIPAEWNLRNLSAGQKSWITKLTQAPRKQADGTWKAAGKFREVIKYPGDYKTISTKSRKHISQAHAAGLPTANQRAVVKTGVAGYVRRAKSGELSIRTNERHEQVFFASSENFQDILAKARKTKLKSNQVWKFRIGGNNSSASFTNLYELEHYLSSELEEGGFEDDEYVSKHISLVLVTVDRKHYVKALNK